MPVSFYGDGTWLSLFPYLKENSETFDPYTKLNLIEEEKRVMREMIKKMENEGIGRDHNKMGDLNNNDFNNPKEDFNNGPATDPKINNNPYSIFCHLITLDSFGHAFGLNHKIIEETLVRFDNFIKEVYDRMDDSTLLVITSDHGVTDEGAHGGVTKEEMSSVVSFISKKDLKINNISNEIIKLRNKFISKCYKPDNENLMIHQDDILPTICYLMNLPIPSNSYGNFIYELVGNKEAYKGFLELKSKGGSENGLDKDDRKLESINNNESLLDTNFDYNDLLPLIISHYDLSQKIYDNVTGNDKFKLIICFNLSLILISLLLFCIHSIFTKKSLTLLFLIFNLSFSVQSVINEDLYWLGCFLLFNPTKINFLSSIFYLIIDTKFGIQNELIAQIKHKLHFESYKGDGGKLILMMIVYFVMLKVVSSREGSKNGDKEGSSKAPLSTTILNITPSTTPSNTTPNSTPLLIFFILFKYFFPSFFTVDFNFSLFSSFLSMDILCLLVFRPLESFFILIISNQLQFTNDLPSLYILLNLSVGYSGLIKQIQSVNYDIFYIFSSNPKWYEVIIPILVYSVYPRYLIFSKFKTDNYLIFDILNLLITLSSTYYFFDSMNFYFHFASRCFFVCLYFVIDLVLISIMKNKCKLM
nr:unnamed protein product [Papilio xuthus]